MDALKRYIILLPVAIVCALAVEYLVPLAPYLNAPNIAVDTSEKTAGQGLTGPLTYAAASPAPSAIPAALGPMPSAIPAPSVIPTALPPAATAMPMPSVMPLPAQPEVARSVADQMSQAVVPYFHHAGLLFFAGCLLVLLLLVTLEYARYARTPKTKK